MLLDWFAGLGRAKHEELAFRVAPTRQRIDLDSATPGEAEQSLGGPPLTIQPLRHVGPLALHRALRLHGEHIARQHSQAAGCGEDVTRRCRAGGEEGGLDQSVVDGAGKGCAQRQQRLRRQLLREQLDQQRVPHGLTPPRARV